MSEYLFVILILLVCIRYSRSELNRSIGRGFRIASFLIFIGNVVLHTYCFIFTVVLPLIQFKKIYDGKEIKKKKDLEFQVELEVHRYKMEQQFKKIVSIH